MTGYGRSGRAADWIAFGDDAGVAAGLATMAGRTAGSDTPLFCGDAVADPLTGIHAAVAALAGWSSGGGLFALALRDVAAHAAGHGPATPGLTTPGPATVHPVHDADGRSGWEVRADGARQRVLPPRARPCTATARPLGADTDAVLRELARG
jgi:crotonobetainyl-CoA:carnitine CoA-transferase CaiB-like acyl-CoA transferase